MAEFYYHHLPENKWSIDCYIDYFKDAGYSEDDAEEAAKSAIEAREVDSKEKKQIALIKQPSCLKRYAYVKELILANEDDQPIITFLEALKKEYYKIFNYCEPIPYFSEREWDCWFGEQADEIRAKIEKYLWSISIEPANRLAKFIYSGSPVYDSDLDMYMHLPYYKQHQSYVEHINNPPSIWNGGELPF